MVLDKKSQTLHSANLGDSGFLVIRQGSVVHHSSEQQHYFNTPYQLALPPPGQAGTVIQDRWLHSLLNNLFPHFILIILGRLISNNNDDYNNSVKNNNWFYQQNNSSACAVCFLVHFFHVHCMSMTWNLLMQRFMENMNIWQQFFVFFLNLHKVLKNSTPGKIPSIWKIKQIQIDALRFERTLFIFWATFSLLPSWPLVKIPIVSFS